jgi:hypothetical protein
MQTASKIVIKGSSMTCFDMVGHTKLIYWTCRSSMASGHPINKCDLMQVHIKGLKNYNRRLPVVHIMF